MYEPRPRRSRWLGVLAGAVVVCLYGAYASRRTPVEAQHGVGIHWPSDCRPVAADRVRIAAYNIRRGKGLDGVRDLTRTAAVLQEVDLAALNEVAGPSFPGQPDQVEQLGLALNCGWLFAPNQRRWHMPYFGNGLLSRLDVGSWAHEPLAFDRQGSRSYRSLFVARITLAAEPVTVFVTHLDTGAIRQTQLQFVLQAFHACRPAILLGDLNTTKDDPVLSAFLADANTVDAIERVLGDADPKQRIDWILARGLKVLSGGMHPEGVSDHPCYWVDVALADPNDFPTNSSRFLGRTNL